MDFDFMSADIDTTHQQPSHHHKKHSTFANVPFADTDGIDDFIGFTVEETNLNQQIKDLQEMVRVNQNLIDTKDQIIEALRNENIELKNKLRNTKRKGSYESDKSTTLEAPNNDNNRLALSSNIISLPSILRPSPTSQTTEGSALFSKINMKNNNTLPNKPAVQTQELKHQMSASLNNFLDTLDFKFKEDNETKVVSDHDNKEDNDEEYIYNPTAVMDIDGHLPQLRRSSLSEEEQERMEIQAVNDMKVNVDPENKNQKNNQNNYIATSPYNNVIINDSKVNNMNMNIINHHNHTHGGKQQHLQLNMDTLKHEMQELRNELLQMKIDKIQLIKTTSDEMDHLRAIIRNHMK